MTFKYIWLYIRSLSIVFLLIDLVGMGMLILPFLADGYELYKIPLVGLELLVPLGAIIGALLLASIRGLYFQKKQEKAMHVRFTDEGMCRPDRSGLLFFSEDWCLWAGRFCFHRDYIKDISVGYQESHWRTIPLTRITFLLIDGDEFSFNVLTDTEQWAVECWFARDRFDELRRRAESEALRKKKTKSDGSGLRVMGGLYVILGVIFTAIMATAWHFDRAGLGNVMLGIDFIIFGAVLYAVSLFQSRKSRKKKG